MGVLVSSGEGQIGFTDFYWLVPKTILLPGGSKVTLRHDQFLQVEERLLEDPASTELAQALYEYDLENNITQITELFGSSVFSYDSLYRLTKADYPWEVGEYPSLSSGEQFDYDGVGNRTVYRKNQSPDELVLSYNSHNQLVDSSDGAVFTYNTNGHTVRKVHNGHTTDYIYNREERLIEVNIDGSTVGRYSYNPHGQRVRKVVDGQATWFLYNDAGLAAEYDDSGNLIKEYHFKPYRPWMTEPLFQRTADGSVYYYQNGHLGTPQRIVDKSGAVVWEARYEAFGGAEITKAQVGNNLRFPGQYYDLETGLHHNYFRDYDPKFARYVQEDPIGILGGMNVYSYSGQQPLRNSDPLGLFLWPWEEPLEVTGGSPEQREAVMEAFERIMGTCRGKEMMEAIKGPWYRRGRPVKLNITPPGSDLTATRFDFAIGTPSRPLYILLDFDRIGQPEILTTEGWEPITLESFLAHELGHYVFDDKDKDVRTGAGTQRDMYNVRKNENPIREELGMLPRCAYARNVTTCEPGFH